jgi:hypothetical protein
MCYLKGDDHEKWTFKRSMNRDDGVDLIGGCAAWANIGESHLQYSNNGESQELIGSTGGYGRDMLSRLVICSRG